MATYRTGTITVTNGSKTVTGASTLFKTAGVVSGDQLYIVDANNIPTGYLYEVDVVDSDTLITLKQNYQGATISDQSYMIMNMAGNQTVPNFAARLAPIMQSWGDITENINTTPQINGIPQAGETGKIDKGWLPDATAEAKGVIELATNAEVIQGSDTGRAVTPAGLLAGFPTRLRSNLLGTVSQTGGVPTGAVIESGSNANGSYVKFADGTWMGYKYVSYTDLDLTIRCTKTEILPISVLSLTNSFASVSGSCTTVGELTTSQIRFNGSLNAVEFDLYMPSGATSSMTINVAIFAIGRWY